MADPSTCAPLTRESVQEAHERIHTFIHKTPVFTSTTLSDLVSTPQTSEAFVYAEGETHKPAQPRVRLFFKCENYQKIGAFKARGAFHALSRLSSEQLAKGVVTHSSGNHAQALALAARTKGVKAHIVMPTISTPSKIAGTKGYGAEVMFSGSTAEEREEVVKGVIERTGAVLVPPYDHPDIILGQGTMALELEEQVGKILKEEEHDAKGRASNGQLQRSNKLDAVITPLGGGGMLSGVATAMSGTGTKVFGAEPSFQGADDGRRGLKAGNRIEKVNTLTIADGLRTPLSDLTWSVISDPAKVKGVFAVSEEQIKSTMRLVMERMKIFVEPSAVVGLAALLHDEDLRSLIMREQQGREWNVGVVLSGGNTTLEAISKLFAPPNEEKGERAEGTLGIRGDKQAENVAG